MDNEKQHIRCRTIIEILGKPKEHVEQTIKKYVSKIDEDSDLIIINKKFSEPKEQDKFWSAFVEMEIVVKGIPKMIGFCFDYMPSSVEILKPEELVMDSKSIEDFINDLQARLHSLDMAVKQTKTENDFLKRNLNNLFKNVILLALAQRTLDIDTLSKVTGIEKKELEIFINILLEEGIIEKEGELYSLKKNGTLKEKD